jgi:hypothetical protein
MFLFVISVDWIIADMLSVRQGSLGHLRYILKDGLRYFPLYGYYFEQVSRKVGKGTVIDKLK